MTKQEIQQYFRRISYSLEKKQLKKAFDLLSFLLSTMQNWQLKEQLSELEDHYKLMLNYLVEGVKDPQQQKIYQDLLRSIYKLSDQIELQIKTINNWSFFYDNRKTLSFYAPESISQLSETLDEWIGKLALINLLEEGEEKERNVLSLDNERDALEMKIFRKIWLSDPWKTEEFESWKKLLNKELLPVPFKCLIHSALTLSLEEVFDEKKALLLFESCEQENEEIRQRALVGILLFLRKYNNRLFLFPKIDTYLQHLAETPGFISEIRNILLQFILSKETEKVSRKIKEEILPEMMKISPDLTKKIKLDDLMGDSGFNEKNPEWQNLIEESGLTDKLQEFSEMQMEGVDVMLSSFIHLKNYAFFNEISHWFLPFMSRSETNHPDFGGLVKIMEESTLLCNSDKYSFFLSIMNMPESYRKMMTSQFSAESSAMSEMLKEELPDKSKKIHPVARQYIQDLYRFFKLYPRHRDFEDIFEIKPEFYQIPKIAEIISHPDDLMIIADYYFNRNYYKEAENLFDKLLKSDLNNEVLFQKKGYCLQMQDDLEGALQNYQNAELINAGNNWTIKKIAYCLRVLRRNEEALDYYRKAEQLNPDNLSIQLNIGHCYLELKQYDEALKCYFKVEYLSPSKEKAWRPIAWCSFLTGKYEQAMNYYQKILEGEPNATDFLNAGHTYLAMGNAKEAIHLYDLSLTNPDNSLDKFIESFTNDIPDLVRAGVSENDLPYILDKLMYEV